MDTTGTATRHAVDTAEGRAGGRCRLEPMVPLVCAVVFGLLAWQVASHGVVTTMDFRIRDALGSVSDSGLGRAALPWAHRICALGNSDVAGPVLGFGAILAALLRRSARPLVAAAFAAALLVAIVIPVKLELGRPGPDAPWERLEWYGYFPSGHTATVLICYGTLAAVFSPLVGLVWRRVLAALVVLMGVVVGACLVYSRFHWTSDVVASFALGALVLWLLFRAPRVLRR